MTSSDREILISINEQLVRMSVKSDTDKGFQTEVLTRLDKLETTQSEVLTRLDKLEQTTVAIQQEQTIMRHDISNLQTSVYWGFAIIAFVAAIVPTFREKRNPPQEKQAPAPVVHVYTYPANPEVSVQSPKEEKVA